jgi:hypothetical protein
MLAQLHFAAAAGWVAMGIVALVWILASLVVAQKMEKEGVIFWKGFVTCALLTPAVGLLAVALARLLKPNRPLVQTATRS